MIVMAIFCGAVRTVPAQELALKTNALYWAASAPNIGVEIGTGRRMTLDLFGSYRPWRLRDEADASFWLVQPELRYWLRRSFEGHFFGVHLHGAQYSARGRERIYDGSLAGGGFTYGYCWRLSRHWRLESLLGVGYARLWYDERLGLLCRKCVARRSDNYVGPTRIALTVSCLF